jgi:hypothetical protein
VWVPGYWSWDGDRNGYIWVSACWRAAPPNTYWVPGYWARVPEGWEWVAGFWAPVSAQSIEYLPAPPAIDDVQAPGPPPSEDDTWVPGCQYWYQGHYVLRRGYWLQQRPGWVWVPSHYIWTPRGYVFCQGRWDYSLDRRGVLFAPVYFPRPLYLRAGFSWSPSICIDLGVLQLNLFTYPRYSHYCFGDYYDDAYLRIGIYPRFETERHRTWYDPIYQYDRWEHRRTEPRWEEHERHEYDLRRADRDLRPARTYHELEVRQIRLPDVQRRDIQMARPLSAVVAAKTSGLRFQRIDSATQRRIATQATGVQRFRDQRNRWESPAGEKPAQTSTPRRGSVTSQTGRPEPGPTPRQGTSPVNPPAERSAPVTPQVERREPAPTPREGSSTVNPPTERRAPVTPLVERREPAPTPREGSSTVSPPAERTAPFVSPRSVRATKSESVRIPRPPITGKAASSDTREAGPPPRPSQERQTTRDTKSQPAEKNTEKNKSR